MPKTYGKVADPVHFKEGWCDLEVVKEEVFKFSYGDVLQLTFTLPDGTNVVSIATIRETISPRTRLFKWVTVLIGEVAENTKLTEGMFIGKKCRGFVRIQFGSKGPFLKAVKLERLTERPRRT